MRLLSSFKALIDIEFICFIFDKGIKYNVWKLNFLNCKLSSHSYGMICAKELSRSRQRLKKQLLLNQKCLILLYFVFERYKNRCWFTDEWPVIYRHELPSYRQSTLACGHVFIFPLFSVDCRSGRTCINLLST